MDQYSAGLIQAVDSVLERWLRAMVIQAAERGLGSCPPELHAAAAELAARVAPTVVGELRSLLEADVDQQRANPLQILRRAVRSPNDLLSQFGVPRPARSSFELEQFPQDWYALSPAHWDDIDASLSEPGIVWGAWKAKTILDRRRAEGHR